MSRNPYLAASRPLSSYTRSSRSSSRTAGAVGGLLGRSRSSAAIGSSMGHSNFATGGGSSYNRSSTYIPSYTPSSAQRSYSSTRATSKYGQNDSFSRSNDDYKPSDEIVDDRSKTLDSNRSLCRSTSSHQIRASGSSIDRDNLDTSHLKNYQQAKLQPATSSTSKGDRSIELDLECSSAGKDDAQSRHSTTNLDSSDNEPIGDNIPSASARHLRSSQGQLVKSKSMDIGSNQQQTELPLLSSSMSVDRLLLRAESMGERDLRKSFKELVVENEKLRQQLKGFEDKDKQIQQEWIRKERQLQRKISELEEENKEIEQWKQEIQRLKDENSSLIRVCEGIEQTRITGWQRI